MKSRRLSSLTPEEVEYLRKVRRVHGLWLVRTEGRIINSETLEAEHFFRELLVLDRILSS